MFIRPELYITNKQWQRLPGILFIISGAFYVYWLSQNLNTQLPLVSGIFFLVQVFSYLVVFTSIINSWKAIYRTERPILSECPPIAVIIPTYSEDPEIIEDTTRSCLSMDYPGAIYVVISNDDQNSQQVNSLELIVRNIQKDLALLSIIGPREVHLRHSTPHNQAKAGNLNQALSYVKQKYSEIDLLITQDADEIAYPDMAKALVGYFQNKKVAFVQTIKQSVTDPYDPFGNQDRLFYCRTSACRDAANAMFSCGSGVMWRVQAIDSVSGFDTWNLVEDLTTSYNILAKGWESRFHYEALSHGVAPEDLPNFIKQRGTWALDTMRLFWWDNPLIKSGLTLKQRIQFLEPCMFYLNGFVTVGMIIVTSLSLWFEVWPTTASAWEHGLVLLPYFLSMESYFLILAGNIPFSRVRQLWVGLSPVYVWASIMALIYGPNKKPKYKVTRKDNQYSNYIFMVWPQILLLFMLVMALVKTLVITPLYSAFDWGALFWGIYLSSFLIQIIKLSWWSWSPVYEIDISVVNNHIFPWLKRKDLLEEISPIKINDNQES